MAKKKSASSRPAKLVSRKAEDIFGKPLTAKEKAMAKRLQDMPDSAIDVSDIPELTDEQIAKLRRPAKVMVAFRLDRDVYDWINRNGREGYSMRINHILRAVMERNRKSA